MTKLVRNLSSIVVASFVTFSSFAFAVAPNPSSFCFQAFNHSSSISSFEPNVRAAALALAHKVGESDWTSQDILTAIDNAALRLRKDEINVRTRQVAEGLIASLVQQFMHYADKLPEEVQTDALMMGMLARIHAKADIDRWSAFFTQSESAQLVIADVLEREAFGIRIRNTYGDQSAYHLALALNAHELKGIWSPDKIHWLDFSQLNLAHPNGAAIWNLLHETKVPDPGKNLEHRLLQDLSRNGSLIVAYDIRAMAALFDIRGMMPKTVDVITVVQDPNTKLVSFTLHESKLSMSGASAQIKSTIQLLKRHFPSIPVSYIEVVGDKATVQGKRSNEFQIIQSFVEVDGEVYQVVKRALP